MQHGVTALTELARLRQGCTWMRVADRIRSKLTTALQPTRLVIRDDSHRHAGHAGARPEGETHFHVEIVSPLFVGLSRVARQRRVYQLLAEEMGGPLHALGLVTLTPDEDPTS